MTTPTISLSTLPSLLLFGTSLIYSTFASRRASSYRAYRPSVRTSRTIPLCRSPARPPIKQYLTCTSTPGLMQARSPLNRPDSQGCSLRASQTCPWCKPSTLQTIPSLVVSQMLLLSCRPCNRLLLPTISLVVVSPPCLEHFPTEQRRCTAFLFKTTISTSAASLLTRFGTSRLATLAVLVNHALPCGLTAHRSAFCRSLELFFHHFRMDFKLIYQYYKSHHHQLECIYRRKSHNARSCPLQLYYLGCERQWLFLQPSLSECDATIVRHYHVGRLVYWCPNKDAIEPTRRKCLRCHFLA